MHEWRFMRLAELYCILRISCCGFCPRNCSSSVLMLSRNCYSHCSPVLHPNLLSLDKDSCRIGENAACWLDTLFFSAVSLRTRTVANPSTLNIKIEPDQSEGSESSQSSVFQVSDVAWAASTALSSLTSGSAQLLPASGDINQYVPSQSSFLAPDAWATHSHMTAGLTNRLSFSGAPSDLEPSLGFSLPVPHKSNVKGKSKPHRFNEETGDVEQAPEKPYKCPKCGMRYAQTCSLGRHRKKCEGRSGLACIFCGRVFHRKDKYREHLLARHQYVDKELGPPGYTLAPKQM